MVLSGNIGMTLFFRIIACCSKDFDYAIKFAVIVITLFVVTSGYIIQYDNVSYLIKTHHKPPTNSLNLAKRMAPVDLLGEHFGPKL
jgi:hypothetical protein